MKTLMVFLCLFFLIGCASHAPIRTPDLASNLKSQANKQVVSDVEVMMLAIHDKQQLNHDFDEDLIHYGVLPIKVSIDNKDVEPCFIGVDYAKIVGPDGSTSPAMNLEQVYDRTYKSYWRAAGWGVAFGLVGAIPSLIDVNMANQDIKADYDSCMLKDGKMGSDSHTDGVLFFDIDEKITSLEGWQFKFGIEKNSNPIYFVFDLDGIVEQPRVRTPEDK